MTKIVLLTSSLMILAGMFLCRSFLVFLLLLELCILAVSFLEFTVMQQNFPVSLVVLVVGVCGASMGLSVLLLVVQESVCSARSAVNPEASFVWLFCYR